MKAFKVLLLFLIIFTQSCGKKDGGQAQYASPKKDPRVVKPTQHQEPLLESKIEGQYLALLRPIHPILTPKLKGAMTLSREEDEVIVDVRVAHAFPDMVFAQTLREGTECPDMSADKNGDGFVDGVEGEEVYGRILIPLDGDINTQASLARVYPLSNEYGGYIYSKAASLTSMMRDLRETDPSEVDDYVKLDAGMELKPVSRVVVIQGLPKDLVLPDSVISSSDQLQHLTVPIACGKITKVDSSPGHSEESRPRRSAHEVDPQDLLTGSL